jgi:ligand-binding sensor domain-containing protein
VSDVAISPNHVYLVDRSATTVYVLTISTEQLTSTTLGLASPISAVSAAADERLWIGTAGSGLVAFDPRTNRLEKIAPGLDVSAVATDSLGRVWVAARDRQAVDLYDPLAGKLTEFALPYAGLITALATDRSDTVWVGTDSGQTFGLRPGSGATLLASGTVGRPINSLVVDVGGTVYLVSRSASGLVYAPVRLPNETQVAPNGASEPMFDSLGRAWIADRVSGGFYVTLPGGRP